MVAKKEVCKCGHRSTGYTDKDFNKQSLKAIRDGTVIEFEHTCDPKVARRIASDHVSELGSLYYVELDKLEKKLSKLKQDLPDKRKTKCPTTNSNKKSEITVLTAVRVMKPVSRFEDIIK